MNPYRSGSFTQRLTLALALLLLVFAALVAVLSRHVVTGQEQESLQRLSHGLARHIVEHWPAITAADPNQADRAARAALLQMLMVVNPGIQVYVLDADGQVKAYIGDPGMVRQPSVQLQPIRDFLGGAALPLLGTDPMQADAPGGPAGQRTRIFSAAMFAPRAGDLVPPGYLYIVLDGQARELVAAQASVRRLWLSAGLAAGVGLLVTLALGGFAFNRLTRPLHRLAERMRDYGGHGAQAEAPSHGRPEATPKTPGLPPAGVIRDEVQAIARAYDDMTRRIERHAEQAQRQSQAHREVMTSVAHDLRTPLTALHGHLEALSGDALAQVPNRERLLAAALAQSDKVRRLSQQLFELAALQSTDQVLHRERFSLDELVTDAVQKFELTQTPAPVALTGEAPGHLALDGDLQLIERALTNLIDNAIRHGSGAAPVRVSVRRVGDHAQVLVEDSGPGLSAELTRRLALGESLRDPPCAAREAAWVAWAWPSRNAWRPCTAAACGRWRRPKVAPGCALFCRWRPDLAARRVPRAVPANKAGALAGRPSGAPGPGWAGSVSAPRG